MKLSRRSSASKLPCRLASARRATHCGRGRELDALAGEAGADREGDREVGLAGAGGPSRSTFSRPWRKSSWPRCSITVFLTERWKLKSNSSRVLRAGKRAALILASPPWLSRAETSVPSNVSANRS